MQVVVLGVGGLLSWVLERGFERGEIQVRERDGRSSIPPSSLPCLSPTAPIPAPATAAGAAAVVVLVGSWVVGVPCCCCGCGCEAWGWLWLAFLRPKRPRRPFLTWARASGAVTEVSWRVVWMREDGGERRTNARHGAGCFGGLRGLQGMDLTIG